MATIQISEPVNISRTGTRRQKIKVIEGGVCVGSCWVSRHEDLTEKLDTLLGRVGASVRIPALAGSKVATCPIELL